MTLISQSDELARFCSRATLAEYITVDTEFLRDKTYYPQLCLVQIALPDEAVAIDALAPGIALQPLFDLLGAPKPIKVFHAARQDIEIFVNLTGRVPAPLFDTQVAAMVCGFGDSASYETLATRLAQAKIDKSSRFTDWSQRPLTERQMEYALSDVTHLRRVYEVLRDRIETSGRALWVADEMRVLNDPATYRTEPDEAWRRLKPRGGSRKFYAVLKAVAAWRERAAQQRDLPRQRLIKDEALLEIASHAPVSIEELARVRGLGRSVAEGRLGGEILDAVRHGLALPDDEIPAAPPRTDIPAGLGPLTDLLRVLLKLRSEENEVAARLVASMADLEIIAADDNADLPALQGWRFELFGRDALALKHGRLALTACRNQIRVVPIPDNGA